MAAVIAHSAFHLGYIELAVDKECPASLKWIELAFLLIVQQGVGLDGGAVYGLVIDVIACAQTGGQIHVGLHGVGGDGVNLSSTVLKEGLYGRIYMQTAALVVEFEP